MAILLTRKAVVLAAVESVFNVAETLDPATDGILVAEPDYAVDVTVLERDFTRNTLSPIAHVTGRKLARMRFRGELRGNGIQNSGVAADAPIIARLLRGCGYALTEVAAAEATRVFDSGAHATQVAWVAGGTLTNTEMVGYILTVSTAGASGVAEITVTSETAGEGNAAAVVTSAAAFTVGDSGLTLTPTFTGNLALGQRWAVWLTPAGLRLDPISDDFESVTLKIYFDGTSHLLTGAFGTFTLSAEAGNYARIEFDFLGQYFDAVDEAMVSPTHERTLPAQVELSRLRLDGFNAVVAALNYDQANDIQIRPDVNGSDGYNGTRIVGRAPSGGIDPEADLVANQNFWQKLANSERMFFQMKVGQEVGNTVWIIAPSVQYNNLTYSDRNGIRVYDAGLKFSAYDEDDELMLFFA